MDISVKRPVAGEKVERNPATQDPSKVKLGDASPVFAPSK